MGWELTMKKDTDNTILQELQQVLSLEDSILGSLTPETAAESPGSARNAKKDGKKSGLNQIVRSSDLLWGIITDQVKAKLVWQGITACLVLLVIMLSFICFSFYSSRENLVEKVAEIKPLEKKLADSEAEVAKVKANAMISYNELQRSQSDLNNSKAEIKKLQDQLANVTQRFEALQNRNAEAVKLLNGRLQKLSNQPGKTTPKP
jgi:DNA repair exonuclease SbcCD ATPase subunit